MTGYLVLVVFIVMILFSMIRIIKEYEQAVIFRLGKYIGRLKGPRAHLPFAGDR